MLIAQGAIDASKIGVTIALRYACARPQFQGKRIMEYLTHQRRLLPALATTYAMQIQSLRLKVRWAPSRPVAYLAHPRSVKGVEALSRVTLCVPRLTDRLHDWLHQGTALACRCCT